MVMLGTGRAEEEALVEEHEKATSEEEALHANHSWTSLVTATLQRTG